MRSQLCSSLLTLAAALAISIAIVPAEAHAVPQDDADDILDDEDEEGLDSEKVGDKPEEGEVDYGGAKIGESVGGATGYVRQSGFYSAADLGGFLRFGGFTTSNQGQCSHPAAPCVPRISSNLQPWIKLAIGYDVLNIDAFQISTQVSFGSGFVANSAPVQDALDSPRDYAVLMANVELIGTFFIERLGFTGKVFGGAASLTPTPLPDAGGLGALVGVGAGVTWATLLTDVTVGAEVNGMYVLVPVGADPGFAAFLVRAGHQVHVLISTRSDLNS